MLKITSVYFHGRQKNNFICYCDIIFEGQLKVNNLKIVRNSRDKIIICFPARKNENNESVDIAHPVNPCFRKKITSQVREILEWLAKK